MVAVAVGVVAALALQKAICWDRVHPAVMHLAAMDGADPGAEAMDTVDPGVVFTAATVAGNYAAVF